MDTQASTRHIHMDTHSKHNKTRTCTHTHSKHTAMHTCWWVHHDLELGNALFVDVFQLLEGLEQRGHHVPAGGVGAGRRGSGEGWEVKQGVGGSSTVVRVGSSSTVVRVGSSSTVVRMGSSSSQAGQ